MQGNLKRHAGACRLRAAWWFCALWAATVTGAAGAAGQVATAPANATSEPAGKASPADTASTDTIENRKELQEAWSLACQQLRINSMMAANLRDPAARNAYLQMRKKMILDRQKMMGAQQLIQSNPRDSLQVLVDDLYPQPTLPADKAIVEAMVKDLRNDSWRVREQAMKKLKAMGTAAWPALQPYAQDADLEVRSRIEALMNNGDSEERQFKERYACQIIGGTMKLEDLLAVSRRNFVSLACDQTPMDFSSRVRSPLLAALRYSDDPHDRDLLVLAKAMAGPSNSQALFDTLMGQQTVPVPVSNMNSFWRQPPPKHDFTGAVDRLIDDPRDGAVFTVLMSLVEHDGKLLDRIRESSKKLAGKAISRQMDQFLLNEQDAQQRRNKIAQALKDPDEKIFAQAVKDLVAEAQQSHGAEVLQCIEALPEKKERLLAAVAAFGQSKPLSLPPTGIALLGLTMNSNQEVSSAATDALQSLYRSTPMGQAMLLAMLDKCRGEKQVQALQNFVGAMFDLANAERNKISQKYQEAIRQFGAGSSEARAAMAEVYKAGNLPNDLSTVRYRCSTRLTEIRASTGQKKP